MVDGPMAGLGFPGTDVDMVTGRPTEATLSPKDQRTLRRYDEALDVALAVSNDLRVNSPLALVVFKAYRDQLVKLAKECPVCQALEKVIMGWRDDLEVAPLLAEKQARQVLGPQISNFVREEEVAP